MFVGKCRHFAPPRCTFEESLLNEEWFINLFECTRVFAQCRSDSSQADRAAMKLLNQERKYLIVDLIKSVTVDMQSFQGITRDGFVNLTGTFYLSKVPYTSQQSVGNTGRTATSACDLSGSIHSTTDVQDVGAAKDNLCQSRNIRGAD